MIHVPSRPARFALLAAATVVLTASGFFLVRDRRGALASAVVDPPSRRVVAGVGQAVVKVEYVVRNAGGAVLTLGEPETSCGCTVASIEPKSVPPGGEAVVRVEGKPGASGSTNVWVRSPSNDPDHPKVEMQLIMVGSATVPYVAFGSTAVAFGPICGGGARETFFVETREAAGTPPWFAKATAEPDVLRIEGGVREERPMGEGVVFRHYEYTAVASDGIAPAPFRGDIVLRRGDDREAHKVAYHGVMRPAVFASPSVVMIEGGPQAAAEVTISACDSGFALRVEADPVDPLPVEIRRLPGEGPRVRFRIETSSPGTRESGGELVFRTNHPQTPLVRVPTILRTSVASRSDGS